MAEPSDHEVFPPRNRWDGEPMRCCLCGEPGRTLLRLSSKVEYQEVFACWGCLEKAAEQARTLALNEGVKTSTLCISGNIRVKCPRCGQDAPPTTRDGFVFGGGEVGSPP